MPVNEIELKVTVDEANLILEAMGMLPYKRVFELLQKIHEQAAGQLEQTPGTSKQ